MTIGDKIPEILGIDQNGNDAGIRIVYFPYTKGISSTKINEALAGLQPSAQGTSEK